MEDTFLEKIARQKAKDIKFARAGSIHTIYGGRHHGGDSNHALERYAKESSQKPLTNVCSLEVRHPGII